MMRTEYVCGWLLKVKVRTLKILIDFQTLPEMAIFFRKNSVMQEMIFLYLNIFINVM